MTVKEVEVLLVEDNASDQELTMRALKKKNLCNRIHVVGDGAEALDFLFGSFLVFAAQTGLEFDVKLTTVRSPGVFAHLSAANLLFDGFDLWIGEKFFGDLFADVFDHERSGADGRDGEAADAVNGRGPELKHCAELEFRHGIRGVHSIRRPPHHQAGG